MNKCFRVVYLGVVGLLLAALPALAQESQMPENVADYRGVYEFETVDYGLIEVTIDITEDEEVTFSAMGALPFIMQHIEGHMWEFESPEFGLITVGFVEEEDNSISSITIDSYDFSFVAIKRTQ